MSFEEVKNKKRTDFGIIIHWGLYSVPAFDSVESAKRRKIQNGSEWYLKRLTATEFERSRLSGCEETRKYHLKTYKEAKYADFASEFKTEAWDPSAWMKLFKSIGASYVILTAKHHDGFCLWPTKMNSLNVLSPTCSAKKDLVGLLKEAAVKEGLRFGLYYSWTEFGRSCTKDYMSKVMRPQVEELIAYEPDIFWFDGDWDCRSKVSQKVLDECCDLIKRKLPKVSINDRVGHKEKRTDPNVLPGNSTYRVYSDRALPLEVPKVKWEHVNTVGYSWGRNRQQEEKDYKTAEELLSLYEKVRKLGGNFLLNVGPNPDGTLCKEEVSRLEEFGKLLGEVPI